MFRALFWKEWRQLALVRWGGIALGALLPIAFTAGAEMAQRGLLPTGRVKGYAPRDLMFELLPAALALGLWPLIGLMSAASAFAGDRAAGTEAFLLERPVPRASVWRARLLASSGTLVGVIVATAALAAIAASIAGAPPGIGWSRWALLASLGVGVGLLAFVSGVVAASLLSSPLGAVLLGAVFGAGPAVLAAELTFFSYARIGHIVLGVVVPVLLLPVYVVASWSAFCRGEPAGHGRVRRAVTLLGSSLAGVLVLFVVLAPVVVRASARIGQHSVLPAPSGGRAFVSSVTNAAWGAGWIVDIATGAKLAFVPPPVRDATWSPDGSEVAILTWSGPLGSVRPRARMDIRSARDGRVLRSISVAGEIVVDALTWADAGLVAVVSRDSSRKARQSEVEIVDPTTGTWRPTGFRSEGWSMRVVGPTSERRVFVSKAVEESISAGNNSPHGYRLYPVEVVAARVGPAIADATGRELTFAGWSGSLSPSGRLAQIVGLRDTWGAARLVDLSAGTDLPTAGSPPWAGWIPGDRLYWHGTLDHRSRMFLAPAGKAPRTLREWTGAAIRIDPAPGGRALFVSVLPEVPGFTADGVRWSPDPAQFAGEAPRGSVPEELVYLPEEDRFVPLGRPFSDSASDQRYSQWAGGRTLARIAPGVVYFEDIDSPGKRRFVIGGERDLE